MKDATYRFDTAADWAVGEEVSRRENPKSVLDVMPDGFNVPWSEVRGKFEDVMSGDPIQNRVDFDAAYKRAKRRMKRKKAKQ